MRRLGCMSLCIDVDAASVASTMLRAKKIIRSCVVVRSFAFWRAAAPTM